MLPDRLRRFQYRGGEEFLAAQLRLRFDGVDAGAANRGEDLVRHPATEGLGGWGVGADHHVIHAGLGDDGHCPALAARADVSLAYISLVEALCDDCRVGQAQDLAQVGQDKPGFAVDIEDAHFVVLVAEWGNVGHGLVPFFGSGPRCCRSEGFFCLGQAAVARDTKSANGKSSTSHRAITSSTLRPRPERVRRRLNVAKGMPACSATSRWLLPDRAIASRMASVRLSSWMVAVSMRISLLSKWNRRKPKGRRSSDTAPTRGDVE